MRTHVPFAAALAAMALAACSADADAPSCGGAGTICTVAGNGEAAFDGDGRAARDTAFYWPMDVETAPDGLAYVADWNNHRVRRVGADGRVQTVVGTALVGDGPRGEGDRTPAGAPGLSVELNHPTDVVFQPDGTMLLAAWHNHKIRRWDPTTGLVHVICGSDPGATGDGGPAAEAKLKQPKAVVLGPGGALFVTDSANQRIRRLEAPSPTARIATVAGAGGMPAHAGDAGPLLAARFGMQEAGDNPTPGGGIAFDAQGRLYLADTLNHRIRRIDLAADMVTTVAGTGAAGFGGDGGPATEAQLHHPRDVEIGADGRLYVADTDNDRVRAIDLATGTITTVAGGRSGFGGDGGAATGAALDRPFGIGFDAAGDLLIADTRNNRIRKVVLR